MAIAPPFNPAGILPNTAVAPFAPVGRGNPGTGPGERPAETSFPPLDQPEITQATQLRTGRRDRSGEQRASDATDREAQSEISRLERQDREVRAHERAHQTAGGRYTSGAQLRYTQGPDGALYATGGDVTIDAAPVPGDAAASLIKAQIVRRAALAPVDPSPRDLRVAAEAARIEARARQELQQERAENPGSDDITRGLGPQSSFLQKLIELGVIDAPGKISPGSVLDTLA